MAHTTIVLHLILNINRWITDLGLSSLLFSKKIQNREFHKRGRDNFKKEGESISRYGEIISEGRKRESTSIENFTREGVKI